MKNEKGFSVVEMIIMFVIIGILVSISLPVLYKKSNKSEVTNNDTNYNDYIKKCIKGQTYMVSRKGDVRQILNENKDPVLCESKEKIGILEEDVSNNVEVNANPYKNQE